MTENYANNEQDPDFLLQALQWHLDNGVDEVLLDEAVDRTLTPKLDDVMGNLPLPKTPPKASLKQDSPSVSGAAMMGAAEAIVEAQKLAATCDDLEALKQAIQSFDGLSVKKTATNIVFSDGDIDAPIMLIGEAPEAQDDVQAKPFMGPSGQLLDKILGCINLSRQIEGQNAEPVDHSVYMSHILNWRPPGNRTPTQAEIDVSLPFIERHIALKQPKILIVLGGLTAQSLLKRSDSISKLRGGFHEYSCGDTLIPAMVTYHPSYLLQTPAQKKSVWADMLMLQDKMREMGL